MSRFFLLVLFVAFVVLGWLFAFGYIRVVGMLIP